VLCGGLANSLYVQGELQSLCKDELDGEVKIVIPQDAWSAIARSAALRGLRPQSTIESRRCRRSYGVSTHRKFVEGQDPEEQAFNCPITGKRLDGVMKWHVKKVRHQKDGKVD
jgi:hypothetical protein